MAERNRPGATPKSAAPPALDAAGQARAAGLYTAALQNHQAGRLDEAEGFYRQILALDPNQADCLHNLGVLAGQAGRNEEAAALIGKAFALKPGAPAFHANLGVALAALGRLDEAAAAYRRVIALDPSAAEAHAGLGEILRDQGRPDEAAAACRRAISLKPGLAGAHNGLGAALQVQEKLGEAAACYRRAIALQPDFAETHANLGDVLAHQGALDEALASYERAVAARPGYAAADSSRLLWLIYKPDISPEAMLAEHCGWDRRHGGAARRANAPYPNPRDPERRLRIGYVSGNFRTHPVGFFLTRALAAHDRAAVEVVCYACGGAADATTARLRASADKWRSLVGLPDAAAAAAIRQDGIDILVDLSGHTPRNQLPLFALKPAPVQASWLGYPGTTGLSGIDYLIMDAAAVPPGAEAWCSEAVARLPSRFCYDPPEDAPPPAAAPPSLNCGHVTFGSFNHLTKVGPDVVRLWAAVLDAVPESRLVLKWGTLADPATRERIGAAFAAAGLAPERLELRPASPHRRMLAEYGEVDIALDPFPFCGGLTSCEALWMGVPVVTLPGDRPASRQALGFLKLLDLSDLAATSEADYVRIAADLAADTARLAELRTGLRPRMAASPLCDGALFTRTLEAAYRRMWRTWCEAKPAAGFDVPAA